MDTEDSENLTFSKFDKENILLDYSFDTYSNFFNTYSFTNVTYFIPDKLKIMI